MRIRAGLLRRLAKATGISIIDAVELRRLHAQCGTLRSEKARIQTQANQYHDQLSSMRAEIARAIKGKDSAYNQLIGWVNRARETEQIAEGALFFGLAECERLRLEVCDAESRAKSRDLEADDLGDIIRQAKDILQDIEGDEGLLDTARRTKDSIAAVCGQRDAAIALAEDYDSKLTAMRVALTNAGVPELEALPFDAHTPEYKRNSRSLGGVERIERLAAERDAAIARAEKAEAKSNESSADATSYATDLYAARHRITELETFLQQVAEAVGAVHHQSMGPLIPGTPDDVVSFVRSVVSERTALQDEIAALKAPVDGEPTYREMLEKLEGSTSEPEYFALAQWRAGFRAGRDNFVKALYQFAPDGLLQTVDREQLGRLEHETWAEAMKPAFDRVISWGDLDESKKEIARRTGERLFRVGAGACIEWCHSDDPPIENDAASVGSEADDAQSKQTGEEESK